MVVEKTKRNHGSRVDNAMLTKGVRALPEALQRLGYSSLRPGQDEIVYNALAMRDTLGFLPTGGGKTLIFVLPALCLDMRVLVFSPLVALMQDQVQNLWRRGLKAGQISSLQPESANSAVMMDWMRGELQFMYVAPERLKNEQFMQTMRERAPDIVVVDEAHSISQWGDTFRPAYGKIGGFIKTFNPRLVLALTATATDEIEEDIRETLGLQDAAKIAYLPERSNLKLSSLDHPGEFELSKMVAEIDGPTIIYCSTVKEVEKLGANLGNLLPNQVTIFHGKLDDSAKRQSQEMFMQDHMPVMVATNAFGMGIDKPNIRGVFHHDYPGSIEALVQEIGRAGRDGMESRCVTLFRPESERTQRWFIDCSFPPEKMVRRVFKALKDMPTNSRGEITMTIKEIATAVGDPWAEAKVQTCLNILMRAGAIERKRSEEKVAKLMIDSIGETPRFREYYSVFKSIGVVDGEGLLCFDLELAVAKLGVSQPTVNKYLKQWQSEGLLTYIAPFRGVPTKVTGDVEAVPFPRLADKYKEAVGKLDAVLHYFDVPDVDKHQYLQQYFGK